MKTGNPWIIKLAATIGTDYMTARKLLSDAEQDLDAACDSAEEKRSITDEDIYQLAVDRHIRSSK